MRPLSLSLVAVETREREMPLLKVEREREAAVKGGKREMPLPLSEPERESEAAVDGRSRN